MGQGKLSPQFFFFFFYTLMLMPVQCNLCAESRVACCRMLGAGPGFPCQKCYKRKLECERSSLRYLRVFARQSCVPRGSLPPPVPRPRRASHATSNAVAGSLRRSRSPPVATCRHTSKATGFDVPFPASEREGLYTVLDPEHAALFWRSELERSEAMIDVSYRQRDFHRQQLDEALARCKISPTDDSPRSKRLKLTVPASPCGCTLSERRDKAKHRADLVEEEEPWDNGKGRVDPLVSEGDSESAYSGDAEDWFSL
jgi:hypothetical protein